MKAITITEERMNEILPQNIKDTDVITPNAKKVLAAILNYYAILNIVQTTKYLICSNSVLRECVKLKHNDMLAAIQELIECGLIEREIGKTRVEGQKSIASKYTIIWESLQKPLKKKNTFEELFADFLKGDKSSGTPMGTVVSVIDTDTVFDIEDDIENVNDIEIVDEAASAAESESDNVNVNVFDSSSNKKKYDKFSMLSEYIEECFKNKNTYKESVEQITPIQKWIKERYSEKHNVEALQHYANEMINKKLQVFRTSQR